MFHLCSHFLHCWCLRSGGVCRRLGIASPCCYHLINEGKNFLDPTVNAKCFDWVLVSYGQVPTSCLPFSFRSSSQRNLRSRNSMSGEVPTKRTPTIKSIGFEVFMYLCMEWLKRTLLCFLWSIYTRSTLRRLHWLTNPLKVVCDRGGASGHH